MRRFIPTLAVLLLLNPYSALAAGNYCQKLVKVSGYKIQSCKCGKNLKSNSLVGSKSFPLVAECGYTHKYSWPDGASYFAGNITLSGEITREETTSFGDTLDFSLGESSRENLPDYLWSLRFGDAAFKNFGVPAISEKSPCWTAKVTIVLKTLYVQEGAGSDSEGSFAIDYVVSRVGKFKKCESSY